MVHRVERLQTVIEFNALPNEEILVETSAGHEGRRSFEDTGSRIAQVQLITHVGSRDRRAANHDLVSVYKCCRIQPAYSYHRAAQNNLGAFIGRVRTCTDIRGIAAC